MSVRRICRLLVTTALVAGGITAFSPAAHAAETATPHLWAWGDDSASQLGDGGTTRHYSPYGATKVQQKFVQIAATGDAAYGRTAGGAVYAWGGNADGESGNGVPGGTVLVPQQVTLPAPASQIFSGFNNVGYALLNNGQLFGWGKNQFGELGVGDKVTRPAPAHILDNVVQLACGGTACLAALGDGSVKGWGTQTFGQLGDGTTTTRLLPVAAANSLTNVLGLAMANETSYVLASDHTVYSAGRNVEGQLGAGTTDGAAHSTPAQIPGLVNVVSVGSADFDGFAIDSSGVLRGWGYNGSGNIGDGTINNRSVPTVVNVPGSVSKMAGGFRWGLALTTTGLVYAWGDDGSSELGRGDQASSLSPVPVTLPRAAVDIAATSNNITESSYALLADPAPVTPMSQGLLAFQVTPPTGTQPQIVLADGTGAFARPFEQSVTADRTPAISPDGTTIAFAGPRVTGSGGAPNTADDILTATTAPANVYTQGLARLVGTAGNDDNPSWAHTRSSLFAFDNAAVGSVHGLSVFDGGNISSLTPAGTGDTRPVFTPDDKHLLFTRGSGSSANLFEGDYNDAAKTLTNIHQLTSTPGFDGDVAVSPDGKMVAWSGTDAQTGLSQVQIAPFDGSPLGSITQLTTAYTQSFTPTWSPDGTKLAMGVISNGNHGLGIVNADGTGASVLFAGQYSDVRYPSWVDNLSVTSDVTTTTASPQAVPLTDLRTNGQTPANSTCTSAPSCGDVQAAPGTNPGRTPGTNPGRTPGTNPGRTPGTNPGRTPGLNPGRTPGTNPGRTPGTNPGRTPGTNPGRTPGTNPGRTPGPGVGGEMGIRQLMAPSDLGTNPLIAAGLAKISLASTPIAGGWAAVLNAAGSPLATKPLQSVSFLDLLKIDPVPNFYLKDLDLTTSALGKISLLSYLLGDTRLDDITLHGGETWCGDLTAWLQKVGISQPCDAYGHRASDGAIVANGLGQASLLALEIEGVSLDAFPGLSDLTLGDINLDNHDGLLAEYQLAAIDLKNSAFGNLLVKDLSGTTDANGIVSKYAIDCTIAGVNCSDSSTQTLYGAEVAALQAHAANQTVFQPNATLLALGHVTDSLTLSEIVLGLAPGEAGDPLDSINLVDLGVVGYGGANSSTVNFNISWAPANVYAAINPVVSLTIPSGFTYIPGSTVMTSAGAPVLSGEPSVSGQTLSWQVSAITVPGTVLNIAFAARPGLTLGSYDTPALTVTTPDVAQSLGHAGPVIAVVPYAYQQASTLGNPAGIEPGTLVTGHLPASGDPLYFKVPVPAQAGSTLDVYLDHLPVDADLLVYHPYDAPEAQPLRPLPDNGAGPIDATPDQTLGLASQGEQLAPGSSNDYPVAENLPLAGVSDNRGLAAEHVSTLTFARQSLDSHYTIEVNGYNGATSNDAFTLRVEVTPPPGLPDVPRAAFPNAGTASGAPTSVPAGVKTLILTNEKRLQQVYGSARAQIATDAFNRLAADSTAHGLVLPVDGWADVSDAYDQWDAHPGDPELANDIVRLINAHVDSLLDSGRSGIRHIVLAGTDEILPMARIPDLTQTGNERGFAGEVTTYTSANVPGSPANNALLGAVNAGYVLSDDPYGSFAPRRILGTYLYPPSVATGRLVETPEDMAGVIGQYLTPTRTGDASGVLHPASALTTGYDFFADMATAINANLSTILGGPQAALINGSWSRAALKAAFDQKSPIPDIASINAHATPTQLVPADQASQYPSTDVASDALNKKILLTLGCHSGFSITDYLGANGVTDFAQAATHAGVAAFVGQTGYGLGGQSGTIAYGERLMTQFTKSMTGRTLGQALAQAKLDYLSRSPNVYDAKVVEEATFYGLPMFTIGGTASGGTVSPPTTSSDDTTGLTISTLAVDNAVSGGGDNWRLNSIGDGSYYTLANQPQGNDGNTATEQNRPVQPRVDLDVTVPGKTARGVLVTGLTSTEQSGFDPVLSRPTVDSSATEPERQVGGVIWPQTPQDLGTVPTLSGGQKQTVSIIPARFRSTGIATSGPSVGKTIGVERRYTHVGATVYYVDSSTARDSDPTFENTTAVSQPTGTTYSVTVNAARDRVIKRVYVLAHDASTNGPWAGFDLTQDEDGFWVGANSIGGQYLEYIVQAVDDHGDVGSTTDTGAVFDPGGMSTNPMPGAVSLTTTTAPATSGWFTSVPSVRVNGTDGVSYSLRIDNATDSNGQPLYTPYTGPRPITGEGSHTITVLGSDGGTATLALKEDTVAPTISITSPNLGAIYSLSLKKLIASYQCTDATSGVATCNGNVVIGASISLLSLGIKTFTVTATDVAGNTTTKTVTYTVIL